jgi:hypothetical protein
MRRLLLPSFLAALFFSTSGYAVPAESVMTAPTRSDAGPLRLSLDGGVLARAQTVSPGINAGLAKIISTAGEVSLSLGANAGAFFLSRSPSSATFLLLPEGFFTYELTPRVHPKAGVETGIALSTGGSSTAEYVLLLKAGVDIALSEELLVNVEPKVGIVGTNFAFLPLLGITLLL